MSYTVLQKLAILKAAQDNKNVKLTCQHFGISRAQFYKLKQSFDNKGILGLKKKARKINKYTKYGQEVVEEILRLVIKNPMISSAMIVNRLRKDHIYFSIMGIYNILKRYNLESKKQRWLLLEHKVKSGSIQKLSRVQQLFLSKLNLNFTYYAQTKSPGLVLSQDIIYLQKQGMQYYLHIVVDVFSNYVFIELKKDKHKQHSVDILKKALFDLATLGLRVKKVRTSDLKNFLTQSGCIYQQCLSDYHLTHEVLDIRPEYDGCIQNFLSAHGDFKEKGLTNGDNNIQQFVRQYNQKFCFNHYPHYGHSPLYILKSYTKAKRRWLKLNAITNHPNASIITPIVIHQLKCSNMHRKSAASFISMMYSLDLFNK